MKPNLIALTGIATLTLCGQSIASTTQNLNTTTATSALNLLAGQTYTILVDWAKPALSSWKLFESLPSSASATQLLAVTSFAAGSGQSSVSFTAATTGIYNFSFAFQNFGPLSATINSATVTGNFAVPGPIAGAGLIPIVGLAVFAYLGRRKRESHAGL